MKYCSVLLIVILCCRCTLSKKKATRLSPPNIVWIISEDNSKHYLKLFDDNGISTPNIEKLANNGLIFNNTFSNAPVCSVARSTLISGCYSPRVGAQYHRKQELAPMPKALKLFPSYLKKAGYYTSNNGKKDYNFIESDSTWNVSSNTASWRNRTGDQPFFHISNIFTSHEFNVHFTKEDMDSIAPHTDLDSFNVLPNHPNTDLFKYTNAIYRDKIVKMDQQVGAIIQQLEEDQLLDNTFIFYFGDHGGVLPGSKGYLFETGLHVPLVIHVPKNYKHLTPFETTKSIHGAISFVDFAPTVLKLAGVNIPKEIDGKAFLGAEIDPQELNSRKVTYSYADRFDEKYDMVRAVRKGRFKYIRNFQPFNPDGLINEYRYRQLAYKEWRELYEKGELNEQQSAFFKTKAPELLFDVTNDPYELHNLANDNQFSDVLSDMRFELNSWIKAMPDLSFYPEHILIENAFDDPTAFGETHKEDISSYVDIANLSLQPWEDAKEQVKKNLYDDDPWKRYWALIVCSSFKTEAVMLTRTIGSIQRKDPELMNRLKATEYLAILNIDNRQTLMNYLYKSSSTGVALQVLNSMALLKYLGLVSRFNIDLNRIKSTIRKDSNVVLRLEYLKG